MKTSAPSLSGRPCRRTEKHISRLLALSQVAPLLLLIFSAGCIPFPYRCYDGSFSGLSERLRETAATNAVLHVVMVHGMGNHCPGYGDVLAANLGRELQLVSADSPKTNPLPSSLGVTNWLREFGYRSTNKVVQFHELTWTPTTFALKAKAFDYDRRLASERVLVNRWIKHDVMEEGLGDALLYLNPAFRDKLQEPIQQTLEHVADQTSPNDSIILIASSLGSKMTFDTVDRLVDSSSTVAHFSERTTDVLMLANQIALLSLATDTNLSATFHPERSLRRFLEHSRNLKNARRQRSPARAEPENTNQITINVVAATDPNDLLSYPVSTNNLPSEELSPTNRVRISVSNIYKYNASAILGVFEDPVSAHTHYDQNSWLVKQLVHGFSAKKPCLPKALSEPDACAAKPAKHL
jgi:hypothetical protein